MKMIQSLPELFGTMTFGNFGGVSNLVFCNPTYSTHMLQFLESAEHSVLVEEKMPCAMDSFNIGMREELGVPTILTLTIAFKI